MATVASFVLVGLDGPGTAAISGGTISFGSNVYVGYTAAGSLALSGTGALSTAGALYVSGDGVDGDPAGTGTLTLAGSAPLATQQTYVGYSAPATFTQTGGTDTTQTLILNGPAAAYANYSVTGGTVDAATTVNVQQPSASGAGSVNEGSAYTLGLSATSSVGNNAITSWSVNWGDGGSSTLNGNPPYAQYTYPTGGNSYAIRPTAYGGGRAYPAGTVPVLVNDIPAQISGPSSLAATVGQDVTLSATFTDPGTTETHTAQVIWGDGTTTTATVT